MYYDINFNGFDYPVVRGSKRERLMQKARIASRMGLDDQAIHWHLAAIRSPGCGLAHRAGVRHG